MAQALISTQVPQGTVTTNETGQTFVKFTAGRLDISEFSIEYSDKYHANYAKLILSDGSICNCFSRFVVQQLSGFLTEWEYRFSKASFSILVQSKISETSKFRYFVIERFIIENTVFRIWKGHLKQAVKETLEYRSTV